VNKSVKQRNLILERRHELIYSKRREEEERRRERRREEEEKKNYKIVLVKIIQLSRNSFRLVKCLNHTLVLITNMSIEFRRI